MFTFPSHHALSTFLMLRLGRQYAQIASSGFAFKDALLRLIVTARADSWLGDLM